MLMSPLSYLLSGDEGTLVGYRLGEGVYSSLCTQYTERLQIGEGGGFRDRRVRANL